MTKARKRNVANVVVQSNGLRVIDLDASPGAIIVLANAGERHSLTRADLLQLLELRGRIFGSAYGQSSVDGHARSLASLGKLVAAVSKGRRALSTDQQERVLLALDQFDGRLGGKRSTQLGHMLRDLLERDLSTKLTRRIETFLRTYPQLEAIPRRV